MLKTPDTDKQKIINYYKYCEDQYRLFWLLDKHHAMHMGYWNTFTFTLSDALLNLNEELMSLAEIKSTDKVLDAGCGVGGSAIYLAEKKNCEVIGITLCDDQVKKAQAICKNRNSKSNPSFIKMDFTKTTFPENYFDVIWAIESVCHEKDKIAFIKESKRILKQGGRLIMADYFLGKTNLTDAEEALIQAFSTSWGVMHLTHPSEFEQYLTQNKFEVRVSRDVTQHIYPSVEYLMQISSANKMKSADALINTEDASYQYQFENSQSSFYLFQGLLKKLISYQILYAKKQ